MSKNDKLDKAFSRFMAENFPGILRGKDSVPWVSLKAAFAAGVLFQQEERLKEIERQMNRYTKGETQQ